MYIFLLLGILCIIYGIIIMMANSGSAFFVVWFALGICGFLAAIVVHLHLWTVLPLLLRRLFMVGIVLGTLCFLLVESLILSSFSASGTPNLDYIVVLGAQVKRSGPALTLKYRLDTAYDYLTENPDTICIVSGGQGYNEPWSEAKGMKDYLLSKGIDESRIIMEDQSVNTTQNILYSSEFMDIENDTIGIVTNNFHMFRGLQLAQKQNYMNVCGIAAPSRTFYLPNNMLREFCGIIKDVITGHMKLW